VPLLVSVEHVVSHFWDMQCINVAMRVGPLDVTSCAITAMTSCLITA
jgi:hypothetical protein